MKSSFAKYITGATPKWIKEGENYEAEFRQNVTDLSALFEVNGNTTGKEMEIKINELPSQVLNCINEHYKGKKIIEAAMFTKADGTIRYEAEIEGKDFILIPKENLSRKKKNIINIHLPAAIFNDIN